MRGSVDTLYTHATHKDSNLTIDIIIKYATVWKALTRTNVYDYGPIGMACI